MNGSVIGYRGLLLATLAQEVSHLQVLTLVLDQVFHMPHALKYPYYCPLKHKSVDTLGNCPSGC